MSENFTTDIQLISYIFTVIDIFILTIWMWQNVKHWRLAIPIIIWLFHTGFFYTMVGLQNLGIVQITYYHLFGNWSAYLRFHSIFTIFYCFTTLVNWRQLWTQLHRHA